MFNALMERNAQGGTPTPQNRHHYWQQRAALTHLRSERSMLAQKELLIAAQEDEGYASSIDSEDSINPHKSPPLPPTDRARSRSRGSASVNSSDDPSCIKRMLGIN